MNSVCVVIPLYGHNDITKRCVTHTLKHAGMPVDIVVVDDGSDIPYVDERVNVERLEKNSGFTTAINHGILWCRNQYKYVHLLNNDTIPQVNFIKVLYDYMEKEPITGIAGSVRLIKIDGNKYTELHSIDIIRGYQLLYKGWIAPDDSRWDSKVIFCDWFPVCSALIRTKMMKYIGILDRQFRNHCSDSEYCIRANQNNWSVVVLPESQVIHENQTTISHCTNNVESDQRLFVEKLAGRKYQELMRRLPLDKEVGYWGNLSFERREMAHAT